MIAEPADVQRLALPCQSLFASQDESVVALQSRERDEPVEDVGQKETHPDAGPDAPPSQDVDAVVPVSGPKQRQAILAEVSQGEIDRQSRVLVDGRGLP